MLKSCSALILFILAVFSLSLSAQDVDLSGEWEMKMETPRGEMTQTLTFEQDGEKITVTMTGRRGETTGEGTIKGNKIEWTVTRSTQRGDFTMTYTGTVEGNKMSGTVAMGDFGEREWTAEKK